MELSTYNLEALNYQGPNGALAVELEALFQSVFDFKKEQKGNNRETVNAIRAFVNTNAFKRKFANIVADNTGITMKFKFYGAGPLYIFAIEYDVGDPLKDEAGFMDYSRYVATDPTSIKTQDTVEEIRESIDRNIGKIINPKVAKTLISEKVILHMCIDTAFCLDLYHEQARAPDAKECVSIILHEIGHILEILDYASVLQQSLSVHTAPLKLSITNTDDAKKAIAATKKMVEKLEKGKDKTRHTAVANMVIKSAEEILEDKPNVIRFQTTIFALLVALCSIVLFPITLFKMLKLHLELIAEDVLDVIEWNKNPKDKQSDFKHTRNRLLDIEFRADEYVASYGYSAHLVTCLDKLNDSSRIIGGVMATPIYSGQTMIPYNFSIVMERKYAAYYAILDVHGKDEDRFAAIRMTVLKQLKIANLPPEMLEHLLSQYKQLKNVTAAIRINQRENDTNMHLRARITKWVATGGGILKLILNGKADEDYNLLMSMGERMQNNELTYQKLRMRNA
jgi:hypothetical protein